MSNKVFVNIKKRKNYGELKKLFKHNRRLSDEGKLEVHTRDRVKSTKELKSKIIILHRAYKEEFEQKADYNQLIARKFKENKVKPRNNSVIAATAVLSASSPVFRPDYENGDPDGAGKYDEERVEKFKKAAKKFAFKTFGEDNIISMELHLSETTPHIHLTFVPIVEKEVKVRETKKQKLAREERGEPKPTKVVKSLSARDMLNKKLFNELQESFSDFCKAEGLDVAPGEKKEFTQAKHTETDEYARRVHQALNNEIEVENVERPKDVNIYGFKMPKPKKFEGASHYKERCGKLIEEMVEEQIGEDFKIFSEEANYSLNEQYKTISVLAEELKLQKEKNEKLVQVNKEFSDKISELTNGAGLADKIIKDIDAEHVLEMPDSCDDVLGRIKPKKARRPETPVA
ncbi:plasmid recombination protein [Halomonas sp. I5-271120]|uniref:plasmid recombination protein n=1 Tax=Halomonas sp. I5-271120 TaxID=3061632 RepID=UPI0027146D2A|nr:plasmid recombination protein [Halomonas sp. I5-271120]